MCRWMSAGCFVLLIAGCTSSGGGKTTPAVAVAQNPGPALFAKHECDKSFETVTASRSIIAASRVTRVVDGFASTGGALTRVSVLCLIPQPSSNHHSMVFGLFRIGPGRMKPEFIGRQAQPEISCSNLSVRMVPSAPTATNLHCT